jgi:hypothetical protein
MNHNFKYLRLLEEPDEYSPESIFGNLNPITDEKNEKEVSQIDEETISGNDSTVLC